MTIGHLLWMKKSTDTQRFYFYKYCIWKILKSCSWDEDRCSIHGPESGSYQHDDLNSSTFLWKFAKKRRVCCQHRGFPISYTTDSKPVPLEGWTSLGRNRLTGWLPVIIDRLATLCSGSSGATQAAVALWTHAWIIVWNRWCEGFINCIARTYSLTLTCGTKELCLANKVNNLNSFQWWALTMKNQI